MGEEVTAEMRAFRAIQDLRGFDISADSYDDDELNHIIELFMILKSANEKIQRDEHV